MVISLPSEYRLVEVLNLSRTAFEVGHFFTSTHGEIEVQSFTMAFWTLVQGSAHGDTCPVLPVGRS